MIIIILVSFDILPLSDGRGRSLAAVTYVKYEGTLKNLYGSLWW